MTTDEQVRRLMSLIKKGMSLCTAAAKSGMSEPTARKYRRAGKLPRQIKAPRTWRTRPNSFEAVWPEVLELLDRDAGLQAKTVLEELLRLNSEKCARRCPSAAFACQNRPALLICLWNRTLGALG